MVAGVQCVRSCVVGGGGAADTSWGVRLQQVYKTSILKAQHHFSATRTRPRPNMQYSKQAQGQSTIVLSCRASAGAIAGTLWGSVSGVGWGGVGGGEGFWVLPGVASEN